MNITPNQISAFLTQLYQSVHLNPVRLNQTKLKTPQKALSLTTIQSSPMVWTLVMSSSHEQTPDKPCSNCRSKSKFLSIQYLIGIWSYLASANGENKSHGIPFFTHLFQDTLICCLFRSHFWTSDSSLTTFDWVSSLFHAMFNVNTSDFAYRKHAKCLCKNKVCVVLQCKSSRNVLLDILHTSFNRDRWRQWNGKKPLPHRRCK